MSAEPRSRRSNVAPAIRRSPVAHESKPGVKMIETTFKLPVEGTHRNMWGHFWGTGEVKPQLIHKGVLFLNLVGIHDYGKGPHPE